MSWRSVAAVLEDAEDEETERAAAVLAQAEEEGVVMVDVNRCPAISCTKEARHTGRHNKHGEASNDRGGSGVPPEKAPAVVVEPETSVIGRGASQAVLDSGMEVHVTTSIVFAPALLVNHGTVLGLGGYRVKVASWDGERFTAEVLD